MSTNHPQSRSGPYSSKLVISGSILHALVRMMDQPWVNDATVQRHLQGSQSQLRVDVARDGPTDAATTKSIEQHCQINKLTQQANVSDVGHPELIDV